MKCTLKCNTLLFLLLCMFLSGRSAMAAGSDETSICLNGIPLVLEHPAYIEDGVTMVPAEEFLQLWGGPVQCRPQGEPLPGGMLTRWSEDGGNVLTASWYEHTLILIPEAETMTADGEEITLLRPARLENGILYAPLRPIAETLDAAVEGTSTVVELSYLPRQQITVDNLLDLFNAVAPDTQITLAPGKYSLGDLEIDKINNPYIEVSFDVFDTTTGEYNTGRLWEITIRNVRDMTISLPNARVSTPWAYADVWRFADCSRINLWGGTAVHDVEPGSCAGNCVELENCRDVYLTEVTMDGSGAYGLCANDCQRITLGSCKIQNCSYGVVSLWNSQDINLRTCRITGCQGCFHMVEVCDTKSVRVWECIFRDNSASAIVESCYGAQSVVFDRCSFQDNRFNSLFDYGWQSSGGASFVDCTGLD